MSVVRGLPLRRLLRRATLDVCCCEAAMSHLSFETKNVKNSMKTRRTFLIQVAGVSGAAVLGTQAAHAQAMVAETDPQASALGYKADATKVDKTKQPKYAAGQLCSNCAIYQGKPADASGGCPLFAGKAVAAKGWCSAYAKKA